MKRINHTSQRDLVSNFTLPKTMDLLTSLSLSFLFCPVKTLNWISASQRDVASPGGPVKQSLLKATQVSASLGLRSAGGIQVWAHSVLLGPHFENHLIRWSKIFIMSNILISPYEDFKLFPQFFLQQYLYTDLSTFYYTNNRLNISLYWTLIDSLQYFLRVYFLRK